jgi:rhamnosyltransferase
MIQNNVCGVIVTFHAQPSVLVNIMQLRPQVQHLVIVDNGSSKSELSPLYEAERELDFSLIENGENLGIAAALNIGVRWAQAQNCEWVVLFDQDSRTTDDFIDKVMDSYLKAESREHIGIVSGRFRGPDIDIDRYDYFAITSGSLMPLRIFEEIGFFEERLFIDCVDDEYCLRLGRAGYLILITGKRVLIHALGTPVQYRLPFSTRTFYSANYGAKRRYYRNRNRAWLILHNWWRYPRWCKGSLSHMAKEFIKVLIAEDSRFPKLAYSLYGMLHGLIGRMGKIVDL